MSNKTFYLYSISLNLDHESLANHELKTIFNAVNVIIESNGFDDHKSCIESCNKVFVDLAQDLDQLNSSGSKLKHFIAWEANPKMNPDTPHITPKDDWIDTELIKMYLTAGQKENITRQTLKSVASASIFTGERKVTELN